MRQGLAQQQLQSSTQQQSGGWGNGGDIRVGEDDSQADTHNSKGKAKKGR